MIKSIKKFFKKIKDKFKNWNTNYFASNSVDVIERPRIIYNNYIDNENDNNLPTNESNKYINISKIDNYFGNYINKYMKSNYYKNKIHYTDKHMDKLRNKDNYNLYVNDTTKDCPICITKIDPVYQDVTILKCKCENIYYHKDCINQWLLTYPICPICKEYININIPISSIKDKYFLVIMINLIISSYTFEEIYNHFYNEHKRKDLLYIYKILYNYICIKKYKKDIPNNNINIKFNYKLV